MHQNSNLCATDLQLCVIGSIEISFLSASKLPAFILVKPLGPEWGGGQSQTYSIIVCLLYVCVCVLVGRGGGGAREVSSKAGRCTVMTDAASFCWEHGCFQFQVQKHKMLMFSPAALLQVGLFAAKWAFLPWVHAYLLHVYYPWGADSDEEKYIWQWLVKSDRWQFIWSW